jgi:dTDP-4-amino-4,6-dideoxygalactose transaminase
LYCGARLRFADIEPDTLNVCPQHVRELVNDRTRAIVCVHYGGLPCEMDPLLEIAREHGLPLIEDAAQALGASYRGRMVGDISPYTIFSFQAIKHITTGDGGMLMLGDQSQLAAARRIRWFGIDREAKFGGTWENDIREVGYKYQMTDLGAALGLAAVPHLAAVLSHRRQLLQLYAELLRDTPGIEVLGVDRGHCEHAAWLCTVAADDRPGLQRKLRQQRIESAQVHFRNDRYSVFAEFRRGDLPHMDAMESRYQVLPLHMQLSAEDVQRICAVIRSGW